MNESHNYMRISKYPPILNNQNKVSGEGIGPHIDFGFLTILLQYKVQGLEIKDSNGQWFQAPIIPGTFLINIGNMIQRLTNDYFREQFIVLFHLRRKLVYLYRSFLNQIMIW